MSEAEQTNDFPAKNAVDIVDRLIEAGDALSLEAAERIIKLRDRGKHWERECKRHWIPKYFDTLARLVEARKNF